MSGANARRLNAYRLGLRAETQATLFLILKGYRIVARRFRTRSGEIDVIARKGKLVAIVEVKARTSLAEAMDAVGPRSQRRIEAAGDLWLAAQSDHSQISLRYDLIAITPRHWPVHVQNLFQGRN